MCYQRGVAKQDAPKSKANDGQLGEVIELVKGYARQETVGPLRGAGRWLAWGAAGAIMLGFGSVLIVLGLLRLVQHEFAPTFSGRWFSLLPYLFAFVASLAVIGVAAWRISKKKTLQKETR